MNNFPIINEHIPVLLNQAINYLPNKNNLNVIDATFGGGGYSKLILEQKNVKNLIALDRDPLAIEFAKQIKKEKNFKIVEGKFSEIDSLLFSSNAIYIIVINAQNKHKICRLKLSIWF